jgi:hypothetical protein
MKGLVHIGFQNVNYQKLFDCLPVIINTRQRFHLDKEQCARRWSIEQMMMSTKKRKADQGRGGELASVSQCQLP